MENVVPIRQPDSTAIRRTKTIVKFVVSVSAGFTVGNVIKHTAEPENRRQKAELVIGAGAIGGMVGEAAETWTDKQIDNIVDAYRKIKADIQNVN